MTLPRPNDIWMSGHYLLSLIFTCMIAGVAHGAEYQWRSIPLTTIAQAEAGIAGGEGFQQVMSIVYAPSDPRIVYMGSDTTQVWKSTDAGHSWHLAANGMDANGACSLLVHPENADIVIAAGCLGPEAERAHRSQGRREGIFRSVDGGKSWIFIHKTEFHKQQSMGSLFAVDLRTVAGKELVMFAGSQSDGLLISRDTGQSWQKAGFDEGVIRDMEALPAEPGTLIIATSQGLYRYRDGVVKRIGQGLAEAPSSIAVSPAAPERIVAAAEGRIYLSNDRGRSFHDSSRGLLPMFLSSVVDLFASPADASRLYAGTGKSRIKGPYYSDDGGHSWKRAESLNARRLTAGRGFWFPSPIAAHPQKPRVALAASNGRTRILRTENGGKSWYYSGSGFTGGRVVDMAFVSSREWYLALTDHGLWRTLDGGKRFENIDIPGVHPRSIGAVAVSKRSIVLSIGGWREKRLAISHDQGEHWQQIDSVKGGLKFIRFHPRKRDVIYASGYRSRDGSQSWVALKQRVRALFPDNGDVVYGFDRGRSQVVESADMGSTWHALATCDGVDIHVNEMAADPHVRGRLYLGTNSGLYRVDDGRCMRIGPESGFIRDSHGSLAVRSVAVDPRNSRTVYAGRWAPGRGVSAGVFRSNDFGRSWMPFNNGIKANFNVWSVEIEPAEATLYIGATYGLYVMEANQAGQ